MVQGAKAINKLNMILFVCLLSGWKAVFGDPDPDFKAVFQVVVGTENSVELTYLNSLTEYQVAVFAVYRSSASEALRGSATTCKHLWLQPIKITF